MKICPAKKSHFPAFLRRIRPALKKRVGPSCPQLVQMVNDYLEDPCDGTLYLLASALDGLPEDVQDEILGDWPPDLHPWDREDILRNLAHEPVCRVFGVEAFDDSDIEGGGQFLRSSVGHVLQGQELALALQVQEGTPRKVACALLEKMLADFDRLWDEAMEAEARRQDEAAMQMA